MRLQIIAYYEKGCRNCDAAKVALKGADWPKDVTLEWRNVADCRGEVNRLGLTGVPSFAFFRDRACLGKLTGFPGKNTLLKMAEEMS